MILDPDDIPGGWLDSLARRDDEIDALCDADAEDVARATSVALAFRLVPTNQGAPS